MPLVNFSKIDCERVAYIGSRISALLGSTINFEKRIYEYQEGWKSWNSWSDRKWKIANNKQASSYFPNLNWQNLHIWAFYCWPFTLKFNKIICSYCARTHNQSSIRYKKFLSSNKAIEDEYLIKLLKVWNIW